eukprot:TRINITY_DN49884_c0_g1_i1.p1 TRINITY_DN49884_c0_g1~~TRINITY_DN49884_c0_g1_i1.p1  ORF type:complete len:159 (+),score=27.62 TRINITY_DN49884_c0_g1_i1:45-521(+)
MLPAIFTIALAVVLCASAYISCLLSVVLVADFIALLMKPLMLITWVVMMIQGAADKGHYERSSAYALLQKLKRWAPQFEAAWRELGSLLEFSNQWVMYALEVAVAVLLLWLAVRACKLGLEVLANCCSIGSASHAKQRASSEEPPPGEMDTEEPGDLV